MANSADFELRLKNKITSPAKAASSSIDQIRKSFVDLDAGGTKAMRDLMRSVEQQANAAAKAERQQAAIGAAAAKRNIENYRLIENLRRRSEAERQREVSQANRAAQQKARAEQRAADQAIKARQRDEKHAARVSSLASGRARSDAAYQAHQKVLGGGMASEIASSLGGMGGGMNLGGLAAAAGPIAAVVAAVAAVGAAALAAARAVGELSLSFGRSAIEGMKFAQRSELALGNLLHNGENARGVFDEMRRDAQRLGLDIEDTVVSFQKLLAAQFDVGRAKELIRMGADLKGIGATAEQTERAIYAITQIKSKGVVQTEELRQLNEALVSTDLVHESLARTLGKSTAEVRKLQAAGKIDATIGINAIMEAVRIKTGTSAAGELGEKFAAKTLEGLQSQLRGGVQNLFIDVGRAIEPVLMPIASRVAGAFMRGLENPRIQAAGQRLLGQFQRFGGWVMDHMPQIEKGIGTAFDGIGKAMKVVADAFDWLREHEDVIKGVGFALGVVAFNAALVGGLIGGAVAAIASPFIQAGAAIVGLGTAVVKVVDWLKETVPKWVQAGRDMVDGFIRGITERLQPAIDTVRNLASIVSGAFTGPQGIDAHSPSRLFRGFGQDTTDGYIAGIRDTRSGVASAMAQVIPFAANDNGIAARASASPVVPMAQPIAASPPSAFQQAASGGGSKTITVGDIVINNTFTGSENAEQLGADIGGQVEDHLHRVLAGL